MTLHAVEDIGVPLDRAELERILAVWQQRLRLDHWDITVDWATPADDGCTAQIKPWSLYDYATVRFSHDPVKGYRTWSQLIANRNVVHELLHLIDRDLEYAIETASLVLGGNAWKLYEAAVENAHEGAIDRLATILVDLAGVA